MLFRALLEYPGTDRVLLLDLYALFLFMASALTVLLAVVPDLFALELRAEEAVLLVPVLEILDLELEAVLPFPLVKLDLPLPDVRLKIFCLISESPALIVKLAPSFLATSSFSFSRSTTIIFPHPFERRT